MGNINPSYNDRVRYILRHPNMDDLTITEPDGWRGDDFEYQRHEQYHGMFPVLSNSLKFVDDGAEYLTLVRDVFGIKAVAQLLKEEKHPVTDLWERRYTVPLNMSTYSFQDNTVDIKISPSGLEQELKARDSDKLEIDAPESRKGTQLGDLPTKILKLDGRRIFLLSELKNTDEGLYTTNSPYNSPPLTKIISSDERVVDTFSHFDGTWFVGYNPGDDTKTFPQDQQFFYFRNDRNKTIKIGLHIKFKIKFNVSGSANQFFRIRIQKSKYVEGEEATPIALYDLAYLNGNGTSQTQTLEYLNMDLPFPFDIEEDDCLALIFQMPQNVNNIRNFYTPITTKIVITEDSEFPPTTSKMIMGHELVDRLVKIITGKDAFYSKALGRIELGYEADGLASQTGFAHGFWIRQFDKEPQNDTNKFKGITTSFQDVVETFFSLWSLGIGIEKVGYKERIRMEHISHFYTNYITIRLPNPVKKLKRYFANDHIYSTIATGFKKGGEYEEAMGLDEYNAKTEFSTTTDVNKKTYTMLSPSRGDMYGGEFARRKPVESFPTTDTSYDQEKFVFDVKKVAGNIYRQRLWQDDFEEAPTGVYSPETATNLRFSPVNMMLRHAWEIGAGLVKYPNDLLRYGGSTANSKLTTRLIGGESFSENGNIVNSQLSKARHVSEWIEFDHQVDYDVHDMIHGTTMINGEKVQNLYGLVEFINEKNEVERGFLFNLKPNGEGKWKILKANI